MEISHCHGLVLYLCCSVSVTVLYLCCTLPAMVPYLSPISTGMYFATRLHVNCASKKPLQMFSDVTVCFRLMTITRKIVKRMTKIQSQFVKNESSGRNWEVPWHCVAPEGGLPLSGICLSTLLFKHTNKEAYAPSTIICTQVTAGHDACFTWLFKLFTLGKKSVISIIVHYCTAKAS